MVESKSSEFDSYINKYRHRNTAHHATKESFRSSVTSESKSTQIEALKASFESKMMGLDRLRKSYQISNC